MSIKFEGRWLFAALVMSFGITKLLALGFLATWENVSSGHSDIAARGVWLLALYLPLFALASLLLTVAGMLLIFRFGGRLLIRLAFIAALGATVGAGLVVLGADPTVPVLRTVFWQSPTVYYIVSTLLAVLITAAGLMTAIRNRRVWKSQVTVV